VVVDRHISGYTLISHYGCKKSAITMSLPQGSVVMADFVLRKARAAPPRNCSHQHQNSRFAAIREESRAGPLLPVDHRGKVGRAKTVVDVHHGDVRRA
jgi:hypothetical protein